MTGNVIKGNVLVAQSGGGTAVINASLLGVVQAGLLSPAVERVYGAWHGIMGVLGLVEQPWLDFRRVGQETLDGLYRTPGPALGSCRYRMQPADYGAALERLIAADIRYFFYIGGNDSAATALSVQRLADAAGYDLRVISVPKTIDNDLPATDHCPGYGTAARQLAILTAELDLDAWAMKTIEPVRLLVAKGRDSGWLAASAALCRPNEGRGPHLIYVPERAFAEDRFLADIQGCISKYGYCVAVVAETVKNVAGKSPLPQEGAFVDAFGHHYGGDIGGYLASLVRRELKVRARRDEPGSALKTGAAYISQRDLREAYQVGQAAVQAAVRGERGKMISLIRSDGLAYSCTTGLAPLEAVAEHERLLPSEYINDANNNVTGDFIQYALPLIASPSDPLPQYVTLT